MVDLKRGLLCSADPSRGSKRWRFYWRILLSALIFLLLPALLSNFLVLRASARQHAFMANRQARSGASWRFFLPVHRPLELSQALPVISKISSGVLEINEDLLTVAGPQRVSLLSVDLTNPRVRLGVIEAHDRLFSQGETLSSMATRSGAVAGINGDYFEVHGTGDPIGMVEINGQLWQSPGFFAELGVSASGRLLIGPETFSGSVTAGQSSYPLFALNRYGKPRGDQLALFTPVLGASIPLHGASVARLHPSASASNMYTVVSVRSGVDTLPILRGEDALVGSGSGGAWLNDSLHPGDSIKITERITPAGNLVQAIGGGPMLLNDGALYTDPHAPAPGAGHAKNPLTAVGISKDGSRALLVVCDGRQAGSDASPGFTYAAMAGYLLAHGAYRAMMFDSGGSSEMVVRSPGQSHISVVNAPSDRGERLVANGLFVYQVAR